MKKGAPIIVGLEIGHTKTVCVVGELGEKGAKIIGKGEAKTQGLKDGVSVDNTRLVKSIQDAVRAARVYASRDVESVFFAIDGLHIRSIKWETTIPISRKSVTKEDIKKAGEIAKHKVVETHQIGQDDMIIHIVPYKFIINEKDEVENPEGLEASLLTVESNIFVGEKFKVKNLIKVLRLADLDFEDMITNHYAGGVGIMNSEFKDQVIGVVDLGDSLLKVSVFRNAKIEYISTLKAGSNYITRDLSQILRITHSEAERIKIKYGNALPATLDNPSMPVEAKGLNGRIRKYPLTLVSEIIHSRQREILSKAYEEMKKAPSFQKLKHVYLIGGGAKLTNVRELAESVFGRDVSIGKPGGFRMIDSSLNSPEYAASVGLIRVFSQRGLGANKSFWQKLKEMFS